MSIPLENIQSIPEALREIFSSIHQFTTSADFAIWLTDGQFDHHIYENTAEEGKYKRTYQYESEGLIFLQAKIEVDLSLFPKGSIKAFTSKSLLSLENPVFNNIGKIYISRVFAEPYYTLISHGTYKTKIAGTIWEIYNINHILPLYKKKTFPNKAAH